MQSFAFALAFCVLACSASAIRAAEWRTLFDGEDASEWKANQDANAFRVVDGALRIQATGDRAAHLFYVGPDADRPARFVDFELEATVRAEPDSNSGIFFHTDRETRNKVGHLANGYEVQLNSTKSEKRKTGSLYAIVDLDASPVDDTEWFDVRISVVGRRIQVFVDDERLVDYVEPPNPERPRQRAGRLLREDGGAIALQAHDKNSVWYFKSIRVREIER